MLALLAILIFLIVVGSTWWVGLWNNVLNLVNFMLASLFATSVYGILALGSVDSLESYIVVLEFVFIWLAFFLSFGVLRGLTELLSPIRLKFDPIVDIALRSVVCVLLGLVFTSFAMFTFQLAPIQPLQSTDELREKLTIGEFDPTSLVDGYDASAMPLALDRLWMSLMRFTSRYSLSAPIEEPFYPEFPTVLLEQEERELNCRLFDPYHLLPAGFDLRRYALSEMELIRVAVPE